ncbi:hypothetical protein U9M48_012055 [Paspalum notatum var. saurae]|uniref:Uncharacterized protein n=1 Tax=Paspalum notatum var. saurae TaxID=547442 RepID=A0AAQ3WIA6_PASNO
MVDIVEPQARVPFGETTIAGEGILITQGRRKNNLLLITGAASICWVLWLTRNDSVFDKKNQKLTYRSYSGDTLAKLMDDQRNLLVKACQQLESQAMHFFASRGWPFAFRLSC